MAESNFQNELIRELKATFPNCIVLKNDARYLQGFPDLIILHNDKWAILECKDNSKAPKQPNQEYYINKAYNLSFGAFIFPEIKEEVLYELTKYFYKEEV